MVENVKETGLENLTAAVRDYNGRLPGDPAYNAIGAQVRHCEETFGVKFQYHPKKGILPELNYEENHLGDPIPIPGVEVSPDLQEKRDDLVARARKAYSRGSNLFHCASAEEKSPQNQKQEETK